MNDAPEGPAAPVAPIALEAPPQTPRQILREVLLAFGVASAVASVLYHLRFIPFVKSNLHIGVALTFLGIADLLLRKRGGLEAYGFRAAPTKLGLGLFAIGLFVVLPLFAVGFVVYSQQLCQHAAQLLPGSCYRVHHPLFRWPEGFLLQCAAQVIVVGLPEEVFFRAYIQGRLQEVWPATKQLLGAPVGRALIVQAVIFGFGHFFVTFDPQGFSRILPGLAFGWLYARTRSVLAGTLFHAACNIVMELLVNTYYR